MKHIVILLVEDNPADIYLIREAIRKGKYQNELHVVMDGESAMAFLLQEGVSQSSPKPDLVVLDLNLPIMDGREVLAAMKSHPILRRIPVIILTTSAENDDVMTSYDLHANSFITKPVDYKIFTKFINTIEEFWLDVATLPTVR